MNDKQGNEDESNGGEEEKKKERIKANKKNPQKKTGM